MSSTNNLIGYVHVSEVSYQVFVWLAYFLLTYFTIQLIFCTIHESYTFWYYS